VNDSMGGEIGGGADPRAHTLARHRDILNDLTQVQTLFRPNIPWGSQKLMKLQAACNLPGLNSRTTAYDTGEAEQSGPLLLLLAAQNSLGIGLQPLR